MLIEQISTDFVKVLQNGNSTATQFADYDMLGQSPESLANADGVLVTAQNDSVLTQPRLQLLPYAQGTPNSQFSMRVYGWKGIYKPQNIGVPFAGAYIVWVPYLLCELACTLCNRSGPLGDNRNAPSVRAIVETELACDTITLTQGALGLTGFLNSTGPGTNLLAWALVETWGARRISFDFSLADNSNIMGMNCLVSRA